MKPMRPVACVVLLLISANIFAASKDSTDSPSQGATVQAVIEQVKAALSDAQNELAHRNLTNFPPLKQVDLALQTVFTKKVGSTFKFWIISIGGAWEKDRSQELDISLTPPNAGNPHQISTESLTQSLVGAIVSAAEGVSGAGQGAIPLKTATVVVKISFTVKADANGGLSTPQLSPITADVSGDLSKTAVQTLTLTFNNK